MPFKPLRLLIAYDPAGQRCDLVVPRMKELLVARGFDVDVHPIGSGTADLGDYSGVIIGTPVTGLGLRGTGPTTAVTDWITAQDELDEKKVALFCVFDVRQGDVFDKMKNLILEKGAEYVAEYGYWRARPTDGETLLPAECMIRIRRG